MIVLAPMMHAKALQRDRAYRERETYDLCILSYRDLRLVKQDPFALISNGQVQGYSLMSVLVFTAQEACVTKVERQVQPIEAVRSF